jgi:hypothetical protein
MRSLRQTEEESDERIFQTPDKEGEEVERIKHALCTLSY